MCGSVVARCSEMQILRFAAKDDNLTQSALTKSCEVDEGAEVTTAKAAQSLA